MCPCDLGLQRLWLVLDLQPHLCLKARLLAPAYAPRATILASQFEIPGGNLIDKPHLFMLVQVLDLRLPRRMPLDQVSLASQPWLVDKGPVPSVGTGVGVFP